MGEILQRRIRSNKFDNPAQEALLNLLVVGSYLNDLLDRACSQVGISLQQHNVLRILRGGPLDGYSRSEITDRMVDRAPDVTRLIDRLERQGLVERDRSSSDRRLSITRITPKGLELLEKIKPQIDRVHYHIGKCITVDECRTLSEICERLYAE